MRLYDDDIEELEKEGIIRGYKAVIDWDSFDDAYVSAIVELNVVPKADLGFEEVAEKVGKSRSAVANTLRLLELGKYVITIIW
mgnify:CR=1 FL=1